MCNTVGVSPRHGYVAFNPCISPKQALLSRHQKASMRAVVASLEWFVDEVACHYLPAARLMRMWILAVCSGMYEDY